MSLPEVVHWLGIFIMRCERTGEDPKGPPAKLLVRQGEMLSITPKNLKSSCAQRPFVYDYCAFVIPFAFFSSCHVYAIIRLSYVNVSKCFL